MTQNTILIVDDKENILKTLEALLENEGYKIFFADNGFKGLEIIKHEDIHLVISDHKMPNMDGTQFLKEVKQLLPDTVRIMLTGHADLDVAIKAINEGEVYRLITKPWNNTELLSTIKQGFEYYNLQQELDRLNKLIQLQNRELKDWNSKLEQKVSEQTEQIRDLFLDAIKSLVFALEAKDKYTEGHSRRVTKYTTYICEKLSLSNEDAEDIKLASLLHDIGKIGVKESILDKHGKLTGDEYDHIKTHVVICERILAPIIKKESVIQIVMHHHEHVDGSGYPEGLKDTAIPLGARIVAVADAFDALLSERPYRKALDKESALRELIKYSGIYFDPEIVKILAEDGCNLVK